MDETPEEDDDLTLVPEYEFEFPDGRTVSTKEIHEEVDKFPIAIENLATLGREDDETEVTLAGLSN